MVINNSIDTHCNSKSCHSSDKSFKKEVCHTTNIVSDISIHDSSMNINSKNSTNKPHNTQCLRYTNSLYLNYYSDTDSNISETIKSPSINRSSSINRSISFNESPNIHKSPSINRSISFNESPNMHKSPSINRSISFNESPSMQ